MQYAGLAKSNSCAVEESLDSLSWMDPGIVLMTDIYISVQANKNQSNNMVLDIKAGQKSTPI